MKKGLGRPSIDARLETLFARGIDPHEGKAEEGKAGRQGDIDRPGHPVLDRAEAAFTILEHEVMRYSAFRFGPRPKTTQEAAYIIDTHPIVEAFVKNAGLGFAIPYLHNGQPHDYVPDFIVRLKTAPATSLIIETKGFDELAEVKAAAAQRWVAAVNADGRFGRWHYEMARQVPRVRAILDAFA